MSESDDFFTRIITDRDRFVQIAAERLLNQSLYNMRDITPSKIPDQAGVYIFYNVVDKDKPFHIGESSNLRQRIYVNQLQGKIGQSALKRKLQKLLGLEESVLKEYIRDHLRVRFLILPLGRIEVEDYLNAQYDIVESRPV